MKEKDKVFTKTVIGRAKKIMNHSYAREHEDRYQWEKSNSKNR